MVCCRTDYANGQCLAASQPCCADPCRRACGYAWPRVTVGCRPQTPHLPYPFSYWHTYEPRCFWPRRHVFTPCCYEEECVDGRGVAAWVAATVAGLAVWSLL